MVDTLALLKREGDPAQVLGRLVDGTIYPRSIASEPDALYFLGRRGTSRLFGALLSAAGEAARTLSVCPVNLGGERLFLGLGEQSHASAVYLRSRLPFTVPVRVGVHKSVGLGDRLGIATPGHVRAMRHVRGIVPVLAQQSIREMERTQRTPDDVMDDATWGVFQEGWREGFGADADHLKTEADIDACVAAGFVMYTLDPREHVDNAAETDSLAALEQKYQSLPWERLHTSASETRSTYSERTWTLGEGHAITLSREGLLRAACKYGRALAHVLGMYQHLQRRLAGRPWELEVSVDETDTPTKPEEHFYIASELKRLEVEWVSLAPRYVGRFEKGVDYIGDLGQFAVDFARHVAVAHALGPYKLSLHSGSDKFSIYPIASRLAGEMVHLKTAGTSYLEALRAIARVQPDLFREVLRFAIANYERDKVSYHVSAQLGRMPNPDALADGELGDTLDQFDARQALHVTFGSVLTTTDAPGSYLFRDRLYASLGTYEGAHYAALEAHITRHVQPFSG